jgi:TATA-box binding protein (TBP) (component of TFIID and TFIIIB)
MNDFEVVNIVGSGKFGRELDLMHLSNTLGDIAEYRYFTNESKLPATVTAEWSYSIWFLG